MPNSVDSLTNLFTALPGVGPKAALRIVLHLLQLPEYSIKLSQEIQQTIQHVGKCRLCSNLAEKGTLCMICEDPKRDRSQVALISNVADLVAIEKTATYNGLYFVFEQMSDFFDNEDALGIGVRRLAAFIDYFKQTAGLNEIIFAFPHNIDSEVVSSLVSEKVKELYPELKMTKIAYGMPSGADFDYTDKLTIMKSFKGRNVV